jgi:predicted Zn-dependent protease
MMLPTHRMLRGFLVCVLSAALFFTQTSQSFAQAGRMKILRDAEIEALLRDYARPILNAAKLGNAGTVEFVIVNDRSFNAFVADSHRIFITVGALLDAKTPNEIIGVLAHETGHIAGGHLARMREQLRNAQTMSIVGMLLGVAAVAAGAAAGANGNSLSGAATGLAAGGLGIGQRTLLAYQRTEEQAADRAAINFLNATHQSGRGMITTFKRFEEDSVFMRTADPYAQSHPMPHDRIANLEGLVEASPYKAALDPPALQMRHELMRAKISGYLETPQQVARRYPGDALPARYARAISLSQNAQGSAGLREMDALIAAQPDNPYFHELKAQTLLENSRPREAVAPYKRALELSPGSALIRVGLGRALVASEDKSRLDEAIRELERAIIQDPHSDAYQFLAMAYGSKGDSGRAALVTAEGHFENKAYDLAKTAAQHAKQLLPPNSPGWLKADDILILKTPNAASQASGRIAGPSLALRAFGARIAPPEQFAGLRPSRLTPPP